MTHRRNRNKRIAGPTPNATVPSVAAMKSADVTTLPSAPPSGLNELAFDDIEVNAPTEEELNSRMFLVKGVAMFAAGDYGAKGKFTAEDLQEMADSYDPNWLEAPVTRDHVQEGEAWGWIENVRANGDVLYGDFRVHPEVYYMMKEGYYKRRSIEIYRGVPFRDGTKVQYVKACSILGAATPEVKGLPQVKFHEGFADFEHFDFNDNPPAVSGEERKEHDMKDGNGATPNPITPAAPAPASTFAGMTEDQFNERVQAAAKTAADAVRTEYEDKLKQSDERASRFATGLSEMSNKLRAKDETSRFNDAANAAAAAGRLPKPERDVLATVFSALPFDDMENVAVPFKASDASEDAQPEMIAPRALLLRYMETKAVVAPIGETLMTEAQPAYMHANIPTAPNNAHTMEPAKRAEWIDKRATEMQTADPAKSFGECMIAAERELAGRK